MIISQLSAIWTLALWYIATEPIKSSAIPPLPVTKPHLRVRHGDGVLPIEVKSGRNKGSLSGLRGFAASFKVSDSLLVGTGGVALEKFFAAGAEAWMGARG